MADGFLVTMVAAFVGAGAAVYSGVVTESYKRHKEIQGTASALAGEIYAILHMSKKRDYANYYKSTLLFLKDGKDVQFNNFLGDSVIKLDPIIERHIDKLGLLNGASKLPERITTFYTFIQGIRQDVVTLASNNFHGDLVKFKIEIIEEDLKLWDETVMLGEAIYNELNLLANQQWWPTRCCKKVAEYLKLSATKRDA